MYAPAPTSEIHDIVVAREWRTVAGYPNYQVSDMGQVRTKNCNKGISKRDSEVDIFGNRWYFLTHNTAKNGYQRVLLSLNGKKKNFARHRLVALAFIPNPLNFPDVCHNDGNPSNNKDTNLRWDCDKGNHADKKKHGTNNHGENHSMVKLTEALVLSFKKRFEAGESMRSIGKGHGVCRSTIHRAICPVLQLSPR